MTLTELDDLTLERARRGDQAAITAFVRRYGPAIHSVVRRLAEPSRVDDVCQDIVIKAVAALPGFRPQGPAKLSTWVLTIAHRHLVDESRRRRVPTGPLEDGLEIASTDARPDDRLAQLESRRALELALSELPEHYRRVFVLSELHGQAHEEIAAAEGIPPGTVKSRLHRARAALVARLGPLLDPPSQTRSLP